MSLPISLSLITKENLDVIVDIKTCSELWIYEVDAEIETERDKVRQTIQKRMDSDWYWQYIIHLNDKRRTPIGEFHIHIGDATRNSYEIGYAILPAFQGNGYAALAGRAAMKILFEDKKAHRVYAMCNSNNAASYRTMEKLGMIREGVFREELPWRGKWVDQFYYAVLDHEYFARNDKHESC